jgi:ribonuclease P protein component
VTGRTGRFARTDRLLESREFQHVTRQGRRAASDAFVVLVAVDGARVRPRLGVTVSRRVGNAVVRNRVKRRIREWFRREREHLPRGAEVVVIARTGATGLSFRESAELLSRLAARAADAHR